LQQIRQHWRRIPAIDDCPRIHTFAEIRTPEDAGHAVRTVEALGVVEFACGVYFVITPELRPKDNGGILGEIPIVLDPIENPSHFPIRGSHSL